MDINEVLFVRGKLMKMDAVYDIFGKSYGVGLDILQRMTPEEDKDASSFIKRVFKYSNFKLDDFVDVFSSIILEGTDNILDHWHEIDDMKSEFYKKHEILLYHAKFAEFHSLNVQFAIFHLTLPEVIKKYKPDYEAPAEQSDSINDYVEYRTSIIKNLMQSNYKFRELVYNHLNHGSLVVLCNDFGTDMENLRISEKTGFYDKIYPKIKANMVSSNGMIVKSRIKANDADGNLCICTQYRVIITNCAKVNIIAQFNIPDNPDDIPYSFLMDVSHCRLTIGAILPDYLRLFIGVNGKVMDLDSKDKFDDILLEVVSNLPFIEEPDKEIRAKEKMIFYKQLHNPDMRFMNLFSVKYYKEFMLNDGDLFIHYAQPEDSDMKNLKLDEMTIEILKRKETFKEYFIEAKF